jgi:hypothetical protein
MGGHLVSERNKSRKIFRLCDCDSARAFPLTALLRQETADPMTSLERKKCVFRLIQECA